MHKTKAQLIAELQTLRDRLSEIEKDKARNEKAQSELDQIQMAIKRGQEMFTAGAVVIFKWLNEPDWPVQYVTPNVEEVFGYTSEEFVNGSVKYADLIFTDDLKRVATEVNRASNKGQERLVHRPYRIKRKDGSVIWITDYTNIIRDDQNRVVFYQGYVFDVTKQKELEYENEKFHRMILDLTNSLSMKQAGKRIARTAMELFDYDSISINIIDHEKEMLIGIYNEDTVVGENKPKSVPVSTHSLETIINKSILRGKAKLINRKQLPSESPHYMYGHKTRFSMSMMYAPLKAKNKVSGIISVHSYQRGTYSRTQLKQLQILADHAGGALERIRIEETLKESEERFRTIFESALDFIFIKNKALQYTQVNPAVERLFALPKKDIIGHTDEEFFGEEATRHMREIDRRVLKGETVNEEDSKIISGVLHTFHVIKVPMRNSKGEITGLYGIARDTTERKQYEKELLKLSGHLETVYNSSNMVIFSLDRSYRYLSFNENHKQTMKTLWGESIQVGMNILEIIRSQEDRKKAKRNFDRALRGERFFEIEEYGDSALKRTFYENSYQPLYNTEHQLIGLTVFVRDISEQKRLEKEKEELRVQLYHSQKLESIGTLASGLAHEINNPLMGIINYAQLVHEQINDPRLQTYTAGIIEEGNRVAKIVKNLLSFSRQDKEPYNSVSVHDLIDSSLLLFGAVFRDNHIQIIRNIPENLPFIRCRGRQIEQVVINILANAKDALNERYPGIHPDKKVIITAESCTQDGQEHVCITVEDHGKGIASDIINRIFDPFFTTKPRDKGTGLGLSVSYGIVKEHKGILEVTSKPGKLTRFYMKLPVVSNH